MKRLILLVALVVSLQLAIACSSKEKEKDVELPFAMDEEITLTVYAPNMSEQQYEEYIKNPIEGKYPNMTIERVVPLQGGVEGMELMITEGNVPDLFYGLPGWFGKLQVMGVFSDLSPYIEKYKLDLERMHPEVLRLMKLYSGGDSILFLPESMNTALLFYNKTLFEQFGVDYPKDGLTWDDARELAVRMSRTEGDVQYRGLGFGRHFHINNNQMSLPFVDDNDKPLMESAGWFQYLNTIRNIFAVPGNQPAPGRFGPMADFMTDQTLAMFVNNTNFLADLVTTKVELDWDLATLPAFPDRPGIGTQVNSPFMAVSAPTRKKEEAFLAIAQLVSDEEQLRRNQIGRLTVLKDEAIRSQYGNGIDTLAGKNMNAVLGLQPAPTDAFSIYNDYVVVELDEALRRAVMEFVDLNTALREGQEAANQKIQAHKAFE